MNHPNDAGVTVSREEDAVSVRLPAVAEHPNRVSSASAFLARSTRYGMPAAQPIEHLPRGLRATGLHVGQPALNPLDGLHAVEERLVASASWTTTGAP